MLLASTFYLPLEPRSTTAAAFKHAGRHVRTYAREPYDPSSILGRADPIKLFSLIADRLLAATTQVRRPAHYAIARADARSCLIRPCSCPLTAILRSARRRGTQAAFDKVHSGVRHFVGSWPFPYKISCATQHRLHILSPSRTPGPALSLVLRVAGFNSRAGLLTARVRFACAAARWSRPPRDGVRCAA